MKYEQNRKNEKRKKLKVCIKQINEGINEDIKQKLTKHQRKKKIINKIKSQI